MVATIALLLLAPSKTASAGTVRLLSPANRAVVSSLAPVVVVAEIDGAASARAELYDVDPSFGYDVSFGRLLASATVSVTGAEVSFAIPPAPLRGADVVWRVVAIDDVGGETASGARRLRVAPPLGALAIRKTGERRGVVGGRKARVDVRVTTDRGRGRGTLVAVRDRVTLARRAVFPGASRTVVHLLVPCTGSRRIEIRVEAQGAIGPARHARRTIVAPGCRKPDDGGGRAGCDDAYPTVCIPPPPPDLDCGDIPYSAFRVLSPDPHRFDADGDGVGCESSSSLRRGRLGIRVLERAPRPSPCAHGVE